MLLCHSNITIWALELHNTVKQAYNEHDYNEFIAYCEVIFDSLREENNENYIRSLDITIKLLMFTDPGGSL